MSFPYSKCLCGQWVHRDDHHICEGGPEQAAASSDPVLVLAKAAHYCWNVYEKSGDENYLAADRMLRNLGHVCYMEAV